VSVPKYLLDENVDPIVRIALHHDWSEIEGWMVGDPGAPERGTPDAEILLWCEAKEFCLVTNNRASMPVHLAEHLATGRHVPGIFILNNRKMSVGETVQELTMIWAASKPEEYADALSFLPISL
jgi:Domain of unknown function (DUF5615)